MSRRVDPPLITRLSDQHGAYQIKIVCRRCANQRIVNPLVLARLRGWEAELNMLGTQCRCSRCGHRGAKLQPLPAPER